MELDLIIRNATPAQIESVILALCSTGAPVLVNAPKQEEKRAPEHDMRAPAPSPRKRGFNAKRGDWSDDEENVLRYYLPNKFDQAIKFLKMSGSKRSPGAIKQHMGKMVREGVKPLPESPPDPVSSTTPTEGEPRKLTDGSPVSSTPEDPVSTQQVPPKLDDTPPVGRENSERAERQRNLQNGDRVIQVMGLPTHSGIGEIVHAKPRDDQVYVEFGHYRVWVKRRQLDLAPPPALPPG